MPIFSQFTLWTRMKLIPLWECDICIGIRYFELKLRLRIFGIYLKKKYGGNHIQSIYLFLKDKLSSFNVHDVLFFVAFLKKDWASSPW